MLNSTQHNQGLQLSIILVPLGYKIELLYVVGLAFVTENSRAQFYPFPVANKNYCSSN